MAEGRLTCGWLDGGYSESKILAGRAVGAAIVRHPCPLAEGSEPRVPGAARWEQLVSRRRPGKLPAGRSGIGERKISTFATPMFYPESCLPNPTFTPRSPR